jgi:hypothetical protein
MPGECERAAAMQRPVFHFVRLSDDYFFIGFFAGFLAAFFLPFLAFTAFLAGQAFCEITLAPSFAA